MPATLAQSLQIPPQLLEALSSEELGAFVRLALSRSAFGPLPTEDSLLARLARVSDERWDVIAPMVTRALQAATMPGQAAAAPIADNLLERRRAQTAAATAARQANRLAASRNVPERSKNVVSTLPTLIAPSDSGFEKAPALQRSIPLNPIQSAPPEGAFDRKLSEVGAGARALKRAVDERWCRDLLSSAQFPWAEEDRRSVPHELVGRLAVHPNASPCRIAFALQQITAMGAKSDPSKPPPNPLALLITALGAQLKNPQAPWEVPLAYLPVFDRMAAGREAVQSAQSLINSLRNRNRFNASREEDAGRSSLHSS